MMQNIPGSISSNNLRVGKRYYLRNYGETTKFVVLEASSDSDYTIKDLLTLEISLLSHLTRYGIGKDFEMRELDH